jgi:sigma-B regulation protein RsbU (phosphoserine phosphatase)
VPLSEQPAGGSRDDLEDLYENAPCGYLTLSPDGHIARANRTLGEWLGFPSAALIGRRLHDLLSIGSRIFFETHLAPMLRLEGAFSEVALEFVASDGTKIPALTNASERRDDAGRPLLTRLVVFKAAERRQYEQDLVQSRTTALANLGAEREVAELREQFIAVLGHDLRNPLASITGASRLLARETLSERGQTILRLMNGSALRMAGLIDNVLDFARGRLGGGFALERRLTFLEPVLKQVVDELRTALPDQKIDTAFALPDPIDSDGSRIAQLVSNLLGNAITHGEPAEPVRIAAQVVEGNLEISVSNTGDPIPETAMPRLFQPFFRGQVRSSQQGLGLGLHIAAEIAKAHGGALTVTSSDEETRFTFRMPLTNA